MEFNYNHLLKKIVDSSNIEISQKLEALSPYLNNRLNTWLKDICRGKSPCEYFTHPYAFPTLLFPWWLMQKISHDVDFEFQKDIVYSSMCGYYFIRLIDNIMDEKKAEEIKILPILGFLHNEFQSKYFRYFDSGHVFWKFFEKQWFFSVESTIKDSQLTNIDEVDFEKISSKKVCAGKIPMMAVCFRNNIKELPQEWHDVYDLMSLWHQMFNDIFDWQRDLNSGCNTYFLSEAKRCKNKDESVEEWVVREGFRWGANKLSGWMNKLKEKAEGFQLQEFIDYLNYREKDLLTTSGDVLSGFEKLLRLLQIKT